MIQRSHSRKKSAESIRTRIDRRIDQRIARDRKRCLRDLWTLIVVFLLVVAHLTREIYEGRGIGEFTIFMFILLGMFAVRSSLSFRRLRSVEARHRRGDYATADSSDAPKKSTESIGRRIDRLIADYRQRCFKELWILVLFFFLVSALLIFEIYEGRGISFFTIFMVTVLGLFVVRSFLSFRRLRTVEAERRSGRASR